MRYNKNRKPRRDIPYGMIFFIFILNFAVRFIFVLSMKNNPYSLITRYTVDSIYYHNWALSIIQGNWIGHEVFFLGPFYAYFLAIIYKIFGTNIIVVQSIQTVLSSFGVVFLYLIVRRLTNNRNAIIASIIYIFSGNLIFFTGALLYVEVNIFLSLLLSYLLITLIDNFSRKLLIFAAIIFGLLVIIRPEFLLMLVLIIPYFIIKIKPKPILQYVLFTFVTIVVLAVIPLRNYFVAKDFVPFTGHSGINFYYGNNPYTDGTWRVVYPLTRSADISIETFNKSSQTINGQMVKASVASNYWLKKGLDFIKENPSRYIKLLGRKFQLFVSAYEIPNNYYFNQTRDDSIVLKICFFSFGLILPAAFLGFILSLKQWKDLYLLYSFIFVYIISALAFYVLSRLRAPVMPFLIIFASIFVTEFYDRIKNRKFNSVLVLIILYFIFFGIGQIRYINKKEFNVQGNIQKGNIYLAMRKFNPATEAYNKAISIDPENIVARYSLFQAYISLNSPAQAQTELQNIYNLAEQNPQNQVFFHLATARFSIAQRNFPQAASEFQQAIYLNPYDAETHYLLGAVYITLGKYKEAYNEMQKTLELEPNHNQALSALSMIRNYLQKNNP
jgi:tetratricopeptide (TPR) repeat protein